MLDQLDEQPELRDTRDVTLELVTATRPLVQGSGADIEDARPNRDSGATPAIGRYRSPHAMLQSEARDFFVVSSEHIIGVVLVRHGLVTG